MTSDPIHHMTPKGYAVLKQELHYLLHDERPKIVEIVSWAAGNGDRSENGDYIYNKKRLREIDRRVRYLTKKTENAQIVDPKEQQNIDRIFFGAQVTYLRKNKKEVTVRLVGIDEADFSVGKINWQSPVGKSLLKAQEGDTVKVHIEDGIELIEILEVSYPIDEI